MKTGTQKVAFDPQRSQEVRDALLEKGYRGGWFLSTPDRHVSCFIDGQHTLVLIEQAGGWDLFQPLTESLKVSDVIAKIPVVKDSAVPRTSQSA